MKRLTSLVIAMLLAPIVPAQDVLPSDQQERDEIRRYAVEVIIFAYAEDVSIGTEVFVPDLVDIEDPLIEQDPEPLKELGALGKRSRQHLDLEPMNDADYTLVDALERLERLDAYDPLMHFGWIQAAWPREDTPALELHTFGRPPAELDGSLTLYLSRYLHLVVDLELAAGEADAGAGLYGLQTGPVVYRIDEDRILRNGEIRYFDHPKFGLIAKVTRVEIEDTAEQRLDELSGRRSQ